MGVASFQSLQSQHWDYYMSRTTTAIVDAVSEIPLDQDSTVEAIAENTDELRRMRLGMVFTDLIDDVGSQLTDPSL